MAISLSALLPDELLLGPRWAVPAVEAVLLVSLIAVNPVRMNRDPGALLLAAVQIWVTNVLVFGLAFSELDRGGPVSRARRPRRELPAADFRFSHDENEGAVHEVATSSGERSDWVPALPDHLYVSLTNSRAFSPTDTMPLTTRAKALMGVEATAALLTSLLIISSAVGQLGS